MRRLAILAAFTLASAPLALHAQTCYAGGDGGVMSELTALLDWVWGYRETPTPSRAVPRVGERYRITFDHFQIFGDADFPPEEIGGTEATVELLAAGRDAKGETLEASITLEGRPARRFLLHRADETSFLYEKDGVRFSLGFHAPTSLVSMAHFAVPAHRSGPYDGYARIKTDSFVSVKSVPITR